MTKSDTRWDRLLESLKNHRTLAFLGIVGFVLIGLASVVGSVDLIISSISNLTRKEGISVVSVETHQDNLLSLFLHEISYDIAPSDFPAIDVLIKNNGGGTRVLTKAELHVQHARRVEYDPCPWCAAMSIGAIYSVSVDTFSVGQKVVIQTGMELPSDVADRVQFVIGSSSSWQVKADLFLEFDDGEIISAGHVEFRVLRAGRPPDVGHTSTNLDATTLMRHVQSNEPSLISSAARVIAQLRHLELVPVLQARLDSVDPTGMSGYRDWDYGDRQFAAFVRGSILDGLAELQDVEVLPLLTPYLESDDFYTRFFAVAALSRIGDPDVEHLLQRLAQSDSDPTIQCASLLAIGKLNFPESDEYLKKYVSSVIQGDDFSSSERRWVSPPDPVPVACGVRAIGMLRDASSVAYLHQIVQDLVPEDQGSKRSYRKITRKAAILALGIIGNRSNPATDSIIEAYRQEPPDWVYSFEERHEDLPFEYVVYWALKQINVEVFENWKQSLNPEELAHLNAVVQDTERGWRSVILDGLSNP